MTQQEDLSREIVRISKVSMRGEKQDAHKIAIACIHQISELAKEEINQTEVEPLWIDDFIDDIKRYFTQGIYEQAVNY